MKFEAVGRRRNFHQLTRPKPAPKPALPSPAVASPTVKVTPDAAPVIVADQQDTPLAPPNAYPDKNVAGPAAVSLHSSSADPISDAVPALPAKEKKGSDFSQGSTEEDEASATDSDLSDWGEVVIQ